MSYRLALYSDQENPENPAMDARLINLIGVERPSIGYVSSSPDPDRTYFEPRKAYYAHLGADLSVYVDAENYGAPGKLEALLSCDAVHLSGGNTYAFLAWLRKSGLLERLEQYALRGVLIGVSAGAILMTPSIETSALCGDDASMSDGDDRGLALVSFRLLPHYEKGTSLPTATRQSLSPGLTYGCPDGSGFIVDGEQVEVYGDVYILFSNDTLEK